MDLTIRRATVDDWPAVVRQDGRSFGTDYSEQQLTDLRLVVDLERFFVALDEGTVIGVTGAFEFGVAVPGGADVGAAGVTWVSVAPTHRRRGVLTRLMAAQHRWFLEQEHPIAVLGASESGIYGRFGYGPATTLRHVEVDRRFVTLRADLPTSGRVRQVDPDEARTLLPDLHERWRAITPGAISRRSPWWDLIFLDRESWRGGASSAFHAVHPDGYVTYRIASNWNDGFPAHELRVTDLAAATPGAAIDLWRFLLGVDLVGPIRTWRVPFGDPLPFLLDAPRHVRTLSSSDGMWLRILDVPRTLAARSYAIEANLVLEVADPFLDRGGRFRLEASPEGASCQPTDREPDVRLGVAALGSLYLGAHSATTLAGAGLVEGVSAALRTADTLFAADRPALSGTDF